MSDVSSIVDVQVDELRERLSERQDHSDSEVNDAEEEADGKRNNSTPPPPLICSENFITKIYRFTTILHCT